MSCSIVGRNWPRAKRVMECGVRLLCVAAFVTKRAHAEGLGIDFLGTTLCFDIDVLAVLLKSGQQHLYPYIAQDLEIGFPFNVCLL
jgi:hypothetical protein